MEEKLPTQTIRSAYHLRSFSATCTVAGVAYRDGKEKSKAYVQFPQSFGPTFVGCDLAGVCWHARYVTTHRSRFTCSHIASVGAQNKQKQFRHAQNASGDVPIFFRDGGGRGEEHTICFENNSSVPRDGSLQVMTESTIPRILIVRTSNSPRIDGLFRICLMTTMVPEYRYLSFYFYRQRRKEKKETLVDTTSLALSSPRGLCLQRCASLSARPRTYLSSRAHP